MALDRIPHSLIIFYGKVEGSCQVKSVGKLRTMGVDEEEVDLGDREQRMLEK